MADIKFTKNKIKRYRNLLLALAVILIALTFYSWKNAEQDFEGYELSPSSSNKLMPQYPIILTSKGQMETLVAKVIYSESSIYGQLVVFDYADYIRALMIDGTLLCTWNFSIKSATTHVQEIAQVLKGYLGNKKDILVIGLGCGGLLKELVGENFNIEVVEINPKMPEIAENYFLLPENLNYKIFVDDGLHFLRQTPKKYDIIIVDLCDILETNAHLYTEEFYEIVSLKLKDESSFLIQSLNIYRKGDFHYLDHKLANSILRHFKYIYTTERVVDEEEFTVLNFFATNQKLKIEAKESPFVFWQVNLDFGNINQNNALKAVHYHLPVLNELRQQAIRNFGFDILLK